MKLLALPAFTDNYIWMLHDGHEALVVDPGDAVPVLAALDSLGLALGAILVTHRHPDHVGGLAALQTGSIAIHGPRHPAIPEVTHPVHGGDTVTWNGLHFDVLDVPGHTAEHVAYHLPGGLDDEDTTPVAFVGDTLFSAGCGRVFDGTPAQLHNSLNQMAQWPAHTRVCPTHEYTLSNLRFALTAEPDNADLLAYQAHCIGLRERGLPTLPTTVALERRINPFLRCEVPTVVAAAQSHGAADGRALTVFTALRQWKNTF